VILQVEIGRVFSAPPTFHPEETWVKQRPHPFLGHAKETGLSAKMLMHDRVKKFMASFDAFLESGGMRHYYRKAA
jgi:hypothetical protein